MKQYLTLLGFLLLLISIGCAPAVIGAGAAGGYSVGTDERSVGQMWDDTTITSKIKTKMIDDPIVNARNIDVDTSEGNVILTGVVKTDREAERAVEIARQVPGVKNVKNNLQVGTKTMGQYLDDKMIVSKIKAKLIKEPNIRSLNIDVDVNKGIVTLTGIVKTNELKERVIEIARSTSGTIDVVDNIKVQNP